MAEEAVRLHAVYECADLRKLMASFVNSYWVNPFFDSLEGHLLAGSREWTDLRHQLVFRSAEHHADFFTYAVKNYSEYKGTMYFDLLVTKFCEPFGVWREQPMFAGMSDRDLSSFFSKSETTLSHLIKNVVIDNDVDRMKTLVKCIYATTLDYSFERFFRLWMRYSPSHDWKIVYEVLKEECILSIPSYNRGDILNSSLENVYNYEGRVPYFTSKELSRLITVFRTNVYASW